MDKEYVCPICGCSRGYVCCDTKEANNALS